VPKKVELPKIHGGEVKWDRAGRLIADPKETDTRRKQARSRARGTIGRVREAEKFLEDIEGETGCCQIAEKFSVHFPDFFTGDCCERHACAVLMKAAAGQS
jgi:hypothetical protein